MAKKELGRAGRSLERWHKIGGYTSSLGLFISTSTAAVSQSLQAYTEKLIAYMSKTSIDLVDTLGSNVGELKQGLKDLGTNTHDASQSAASIKKSFDDLPGMIQSMGNMATGRDDLSKDLGSIQHAMDKIHTVADQVESNVPDAQLALIELKNNLILMNEFTPYVFQLITVVSLLTMVKSIWSIQGHTEKGHISKTFRNSTYVASLALMGILYAAYMGYVDPELQEMEAVIQGVLDDSVSKIKDL